MCRDCRPATTSRAVSAGRRRPSTTPATTSNGKPRRYLATCERRYSWGSAKEDYVLPDAHTVVIQIPPDKLADATGDCFWAWQPRKAGGKAEQKKLPCKDKLTIARVPYSQDRAQSGVSVAVRLPDGRDLRERDVVVEDIFVVALGNSFSSGESNPDRPVQFSAAREMVYDPKLLRDQVASGPEAPVSKAVPGNFGLASNEDQVNPKVLPRRLMEDELAERYNKLELGTFPAPPSTRRRRNGSRATVTARNTAIRSASASSSRLRTATAPSPSRVSPARAPRLPTGCSSKWMPARATAIPLSPRCVRSSTSSPI